MQDVKLMGAEALAAAAFAWKGWPLLKALYASGGRILDSTAARQKITTEAETAREKIHSDASVAHEKVTADALTAKELRLSGEQWRLMEALAGQVTKLEARVDSFQQRLDESEDRRRLADITADVASVRADDLSADIRRAEAERSILKLEISTLNRHLLETTGENEGLKKRLTVLQSELARASTKISRLEKESEARRGTDGPPAGL